MKSLYFRVDANSQIGTGHFMRCMALAQEAQRQKIAQHFLIYEAPDALLARLASEEITYTKLSCVKSTGGETRVDASIEDLWLVLDGYHFDSATEEYYKNLGFRLLVFDDYGHTNHANAMLVLNQNLYASMSLYPGYEENGPRFLLGCEYAVLRKEFWRWQDFRRKATLPKSLLVSLGGADPTNATKLILEALNEVSLDSIKVTVVIGSANPHFKEITKLLPDLRYPIELVHHTDDMALLLSKTDMAICAAGSVTWELLYMQVPSVLVALPGHDQHRVAESAATRDAAIYVGKTEAFDAATFIQAIQILLSDPEKRQSLMETGRKVVDGWGAGRVIAAIQNYNAGPRSKA